MSGRLVIAALAGAGLAAAALLPAGAAMANLVTFGNSFTDEGRLAYMLARHRVPPAGALLPESNDTFSGGYAWGRLAARAAGARYYDYAVAGAMCDDELVPRRLDAIGAPFPSVAGYQLSAFEADLAWPALFPDRTAGNTVYALWIGTNDVGVEGLLGDRQAPGQTVAAWAECLWRVLDRVHAAGGRRFVLLKQLPLAEAPMYATPGRFGRGNGAYLADPGGYDVSVWQRRLEQLVAAANALVDYGVPAQLGPSRRRWPGASVAVLDVHALALDVRAAPADYLDAPANVSGAHRTCLEGGCFDEPAPLSGYMWCVGESRSSLPRLLSLVLSPLPLSRRRVPRAAG